MNYSAENVQLWNSVIQIGIIAFMMIFANVLRLKIPFVKKSLLPTSVLAGFILLGIKYIPGVKINETFLDILTYHGIALGFIALSLRVPRNDSSAGGIRTAVNSGALIVSTYLVQEFIGLSISLILAYTFLPNLFKASGLLLAMGFGQGPGQANNVGSTYEQLGFVGGKSYGLTIAATGFLVACVVGVIYLNIENKRGKLKRQTPEEISGSVTIETFQDEREMPISQSIDKFSIQFALVLLTYLITYGVIFGVTALLGKFAPGVNATLSPLLWGFNFIFGSIFAILIRKIMGSLKKRGLTKYQYQNNYLLNRISGLCFDVMIICGIASIDFEDLQGLWIPFIITTVLGGIGTFFYLKFMCKKLYPDYPQEGFLSMFGMLTGTISSGILLVREIDPEFKTPAANNLVAGSGTGIVFGAPILIFIGLAAKSAKMAFISLGIVAVYLAILILILFLNRKRTKEA